MYMWCRWAEGRGVGKVKVGVWLMLGIKVGLKADNNFVIRLNTSVLTLDTIKTSLKVKIDPFNKDW